MSVFVISVLRNPRLSRTWSFCRSCYRSGLKTIFGRNLTASRRSISTSWFSCSPGIADKGRPAAVDGYDLNKLLSHFLALNTKTERFSFAKNIFKKSRGNKLDLSSVNLVDNAYDILMEDISTCSISEIIDISKHFVENKRFMKLLSTVLSERVKELDVTTSLQLAELFQAANLEESAVPIYKSLRTHFVQKLEGDVWMEALEIYNVIRILHDCHHFAVHVGLLTAEYLSRHIPAYSPRHVSSLVAILAKTRHLNKPKNEHLIVAVKSYMLNLLCEIPSSEEERLEKWGNDYDRIFINFMVFYGRAKLYDEDVVMVMKELLTAPYNYKIHSPEFMCRFLSMCARVNYYDEKLFDHIIEVSLTMLERFFVVDLGIMLHCFAHLNHQHQLFLSRVVERAESFQDSQNVYSLYWDILNSCLYMNIYYPAVLNRVLSDDVIKGMLYNMQLWQWQ